MPLRDIALLAILFASAPICLARPFFGLLMWTWVSVMNPHRLTWGAAHDFPVAMLIGSMLLLGFAFSREPKRIPWCFGTQGLIALAACMALSTLQAHNAAAAEAAAVERAKMLLVLFVAMCLVRDHTRLRLLALVAAGSVAFYGIKGGVFTLLTGGTYHVMGPERSDLAGNNHLAVGLNMALPLLFYLARDVEQANLRRALQGAFLLSILAVVGTYSRGGALGLAAVVLLLLAKSGRRLLTGTLALVALVVALSVAPQRWSERMESIENYSADSSAMSRIHAWRLAWRLALARPLLGWGPEAMEDKALYDRYYPDSPTRADAHSSYFQLLSEGGFLTFGIWSAIALWALWQLQRLRSQYLGDPEHGWVATFADMFQVSIVAYLVSGAFLEMGFFDLYYHMVVSAIILTQIAPRQSTSAAAVREEQRARAAARLTDLLRPAAQWKAQRCVP